MTQGIPNGISVLRCAGCNRELQVGDRYIEDSASGFMKKDDGPELDDLMALVLGGSGGKIRYCEDCTQDGGDYFFETVYGDEADDA